jgi:EAL domain-containing protein (putative c-di-GMP-specific phosphodiesterase class I)
VSICEECHIQKNNIAEASNGKIAIDMLKKEKYDLAFVDLEMPVMDGVELVRIIAAEKLVEAVIILSSKDPALILSVGTMAENDGLTVLGTFKKPIQQDYLKTSLIRLSKTKPKIEQTKNKSSLVAEDLLKAIQNKEITLYFQPKLTTKGILLKGVEALARWQHSQHGFISPVEFIEVAERFGLISPLTEYLFELALQQKKDWKNHGLQFHLSFNLSPLSLTEPGLVDKIAERVEYYGLSPQEFVLEITENAIASEVSTAIAALAKLRLKGFTIAIDDYGTGFANAQQLSRVPATELKIDRILVDNVTTKPQQQAILKSTINLAKDLNLVTVAEGVEHFEDFLFLRNLEVDLVQGYYFAKPMNKDQLEKWLQADIINLRKQVNTLS